MAENMRAALSRACPAARVLYITPMAAAMMESGSKGNSRAKESLNLQTSNQLKVKKSVAKQVKRKMKIKREEGFSLVYSVKMPMIHPKKKKNSKMLGA